MATAEPTFIRLANPVDLFEHIALENDWVLDRGGEDDVTISIPGEWADYHVSLNWRNDLETLHLACAFELKVRPARAPEIYRLLAQINEQMWLGHFDFWPAGSMLLYRNSLMLNGAEPTLSQCEAMTAAAVEACERYYQAFQFVVWAGKKAEDALVSAMFHTEGQA
ncbi:MAG: YbjN domain-containing protein [Hyphomicrobiales bacterium]|nr:YbjN domain-containing protein [Hyphomicrobiales bacterium]